MDVNKVTIEQDIASDNIFIKKGDKSVKIPRYMTSQEVFDEACRDSMLRVGCSENDINRMYRLTDRYRVGFTDPGNYGYGLPYTYGFKFKRNEEEMDAIMIRRVNARLRLQQEKLMRHWKHVSIVVSIVVFSPLVIAAILRMWGFALAWIAS